MFLALVDYTREPDTKRVSDTVSGDCRILLHIINDLSSVHGQKAEAWTAFFVTPEDRNMDLSALPNNNHPDKFLQLEVKSLVKNSTFLQARLAKFPEAALPGVQQWHNRIYLQVRSDRGRHFSWLFYLISGIWRQMIWAQYFSSEFSFPHLRICTTNITSRSFPFDFSEDWAPEGQSLSSATAQSTSFASVHYVFYCLWWHFHSTSQKADLCQIRINCTKEANRTPSLKKLQVRERREKNNKGGKKKANTGLKCEIQVTTLNKRHIRENTRDSC